MRGPALILALAALSLGACRSIAVPTELTWDERRALLAALQTFEIDGRVAVRIGEQAYSAGLDWRHDRSRTRFVISPPLGLGGLRAELNDGALVRVESHGAVLEGAAADAALRALLGADPPWQSLRYWLLGIPDPLVPESLELDESARLRRLQQRGWHLEYLDYRPMPGMWLPRRVRMSHAAGELTILVQQWRLNSRQ